MNAGFHPDAQLAQGAENCRYIFAYGSLIWNPGFSFREKQMAHLRGYHRSLCVYSRHYRGTEEVPGLVLGLDRGGACKGIVYHVEDAVWADVLAYVRARELISGVYVEVQRHVQLQGEDKKVWALTYVVNHQHPQYAGKLELDEIAKFVAQGQGLSGSSLHYVEKTLEALKAIGITEKKLEAVVKRLTYQA